MWGLFRSPTYLTTPLTLFSSSPQSLPGLLLLLLTATRSPVATRQRSGGLRRLVQWVVSASTAAQCEHRQRENPGLSSPGIQDPSYTGNSDAAVIHHQFFKLLVDLAGGSGDPVLPFLWSHGPCRGLEDSLFPLEDGFPRFERTASIDLARTTRALFAHALMCLRALL